MKKTTEYQEKEEIIREIRQLEKECSSLLIKDYIDTYIQSLRPLRDMYLILDKSKYNMKNKFVLQKFGQKLGKMEFRSIVFLHYKFLKINKFSIFVF